MPVDEDFMAFWQSYPRKTGKRAAQRAWDAALKRASAGAIRDALDLQKEAGMFDREIQFIPHPRTWLCQDRWDDQIVRKARPAFRNGALELLAREFGGPPPLTIEADE